VRCRVLLPILLSVSLSVCHAALLGSLRAQTAERIEVLFEMKTLGGPINIVSFGDPDPPPQPLPNHFGVLLFG